MRITRAISVIVIALISLGAVACGEDEPTASAPTTRAAVTVAPSTDGPPTTAAASESTGPDPTASAAYESVIVDEPVDNPAFDTLEREITRRVEAAGLPGASLLVLQDEELMEQEAFGSYDLSTTVPIASASKWLTGVTLMTLVDEGLLDLDEPLATYLPEVNGPQARITLRQLMAFTSGVEFDEKVPCYSDFSVTLAECNAEILDLPLLGAPGTGYRYTGTHLHVAAGLAEAVTGQTWEEIFQERVAEPLGMTSTTFTSDLRPDVTASDGHPAPAGGAFSTLGDYGRFMEMLMHDGLAPDGTRIVSEESLAEMSTNQIADAEWIAGAASRKVNETPYGLAHWLDIISPEGETLLESSPGAFGFRPWFDHVNDIAGVYLIVDRDDSRISDSPLGAAGAEDIQTSGNFVARGSAEALGGRVPQGPN